MKNLEQLKYVNVQHYLNNMIKEIKEIDKFFAQEVKISLTVKSFNEFKDTLKGYNKLVKPGDEVTFKWERKGFKPNVLRLLIK